MIKRILEFKQRIKPEIILPRVKWDAQSQEIEKLTQMWSGG